MLSPVIFQDAIGDTLNFTEVSPALVAKRFAYQLKDTYIQKYVRGVCVKTDCDTQDLEPRGLRWDFIKQKMNSTKLGLTL
eukprot:8161631-Pyramimonas_sp.AAC.1